jgi:hypothetical protein
MSSASPTPSADDAHPPARKRPALPPEPERAPEPAAPARQYFQLTRAKFDPVNTAEGTPIDVRDLLQANAARSHAAGLVPLQPHVRRSRRRRDFWLILLSGLVVLAGLVALLPRQPAVLIGVGLVALVFAGLVTWLMWFVMDDY